MGSDFWQNYGRIGQFYTWKRRLASMTEKDSLKQNFNNIGQMVIRKEDLPLSCPLPEMMLWDAHPRVYLPIEETGAATCPYCGAQYLLEDFEENKIE
jgi:uncharacterized Zn-finger protein